MSRQPAKAPLQKGVALAAPGASPHLGFWTIHGFPGGSAVENLQEPRETGTRSLGGEDPLEEEIATHSSILAWEIL